MDDNEKPQSVLGRAITAWQEGRHVDPFTVEQLREEGYDVTQLARYHRRQRRA